ncbi:DNA-3-methyladenine glycosylase 2 family protein [Glaciimonas immobilis]|uniref:DNA-3-methyladenine glycosylase II n=1 Tax=Glaciimonas immobilis TaxID=728004 RepID=A0A840RYF7_9BURK|nr:DNA-3-methyladenine glycosylase 2 [Glaciimonas immobilis]KAF3997218.1 DNA-3-methyladenine glycosylase 2 family protein [Glaciimonas immobilis]MBB5202262.1 AraC family transcriptional regulator of adaptative response / DNA-3-methyladenine glycosylase II [Glaciimonas immobilis]
METDLNLVHSKHLTSPEFIRQDANATPESLNDESCYRALSAKDIRFDGVFFVGVSTTGIYCRPICTAKTPRPSSCTFYKGAAAAEAAGFRPCLRCRPEMAPYALQQNLAYAVWQRITAGALNHHSDDNKAAVIDDESKHSVDNTESSALEKLAQEVGLSSRQLRRVLVQHFGVTPVELAQTQRLLFAKKLLQETALPMTQLADAAGFGSVRRFNTLFNARYGMAPTALRRKSDPAIGKQSAEDAVTVRLAYRPPFDWLQLLAYLQPRLIRGVESVLLTASNPAYLRSVCIDKLNGWLRVTHLAKKQQLEIQISANLTPMLMPLLARVRNLFDLDANPALITAHLGQDPTLAQRIAHLPGIRVPGTFTPFELAVRAILGQQVSVVGASTLTARLVSRFGMLFETPFPTVTHHFPDAAVLADLSITAVAEIGIPASRAQTIQNMARYAAEGKLRVKPGASLEHTIAQLTAIPGIGNWTAHYIALRALRFPDAFPVGDLGLQKAMADDGGRLTEKQLAAAAGAWAPWRGYAALLLWQTI